MNTESKKDLVESKLKNKDHLLDGASLEKTIEYETDEGVVKEKTTLNYKRDSGNVIDKTINEVRGSDYISKAGDSIKSTFSTLLKLSITFGVIGFALFILGIMSGAIQ